MNPIQYLFYMGMSLTTLIEFGILLLFFLIFKCWFAFLILLGFLGFIGFKAYQYIQLQKLSNRASIFNQDIPKQMHAAYYSNSWKNIINFGEYLVPNKLKGDELLIKVHAASLNPVDYKFATTKLPFYRWICFPNLGIGYDFSGEVIKTGELVTKYRIGDFVFGFACIGVLQEYTITKEKLIHIIPDRVKFQEAASLPLAGVVSYQALTYFLKNNADNNIYGELGEEPDLSGKNILVVGATGGCGHIAIQLAKFLNANQVYGVCSHEKVDLIKSLNICEDVIAYDAIDFQNALDSALLTEDGQPKLDLILDTVSSPEAGDVGAQYMKYLKIDGNYVCLNSSSCFTWFKGLLVSFIPKLNLEKKGTHLHLFNKNDYKALDTICNMVSQGKFHFFTQNFLFDYQAIDNAIKMLKSRKTTGKLVCNIINDENIVI